MEHLQVVLVDSPAANRFSSLHSNPVGTVREGRIVCIGDPVVPIDIKNVSQTTKMKGPEPSLPTEAGSPSLAALEQHADDACLIDCNSGVRRNLSDLPDSRGQPGERGDSSFDASESRERVSETVEP